jgi:hypothetical protein
LPSRMKGASGDSAIFRLLNLRTDFLNGRRYCIATTARKRAEGVGLADYARNLWISWLPGLESNQRPTD